MTNESALSFEEFLVLATYQIDLGSYLPDGDTEIVINSPFYQEIIQVNNESPRAAMRATLGIALQEAKVRYQSYLEGRGQGQCQN